MAVADDECLGINDFNEVYQESKHCSADWEEIGSLLGISKHTIAIIKEDNPQRCEHRLNAMLTHWLKKIDSHDNPSWKSLCQALYIVDRDTANQIAEKHHITNYIKLKDITKPIFKWIDVISHYQPEVCKILEHSDESLLSLANNLFEKGIIDDMTKNEVDRQKGYDGADTMIEYVKMKIKQTPALCQTFLQVMEKLVVLEDVVEHIKNKSEAAIFMHSEDFDITNVESTVEDLQEMFDNIIFSTTEAIENVNVKYLKARISCFFNHKKESDLAIEDYLIKLESVTNPEGVLNFLVRNEFIGWMNYELIKVFQRVAKNKKLNDDINLYEQMHIHFLQVKFKDIVQLFRRRPDLAPKFPVGPPKLQIWLDKPWENKSMYEWKEFLQKRFNWPPDLVIKTISKNCIILTYAVLPFFVPSVVRDLSDPHVLSELESEGVRVHFLFNLGRQDVASQTLTKPMESSEFLSSQHISEEERERQDVSLQTMSMPEKSSEKAKFPSTQHISSDSEEESTKDWKLHLMEENLCLDVVEYLSNNALCDIHAEDKNGWTALHSASKAGHLEVVKHLVERKGCDINVKNDDQATPLHVACYAGHLDVVEYLSNNALCDVHTKDKNGLTVLHLASNKGHLEVVKHLVERKGCDINARNDNNETPLHVACYNGRLDVVEYLSNNALCDVHSTTISYFMPCALKPANIESEHRNETSTPAPLLIWFECGYCPVGVYCCLVVYLLSLSEKTEFKWELANPPHYRNKITFTVGKQCDRVTILSRATYIEVWVDQTPGLKAVPLKSLCQHIRTILNQGINAVTQTLHYSYNSRHYFGFPCCSSSSSCLPPHPAVCKDEEPVVARCILKKCETTVLKDNHSIWFEQVSEDTVSISHIYQSVDSIPIMSLGDDDLDDVCKAVSGCVMWMQLGLELGLKYSRLKMIEIERRGRNSYCMRDMIAAWLRGKDKVVKEGVPTWKQLIQALTNIGEISLSEEISLNIKKQRKVSNPVRSEKKKGRRDVSTDDKRSVKKRKKEMKKRRTFSDTDSDTEERGDYKQTHRYKKRKTIYKDSGSDSSNIDDEKEEMTSKVRRKRIESSFDSHESTNIKKRRLESSDSDSELEYQSDYASIIRKRSKRRQDKHVSRSKKQRMDLDERSVATKVRGKGPASGKPYKRKRVPENIHDTSNTESEDDDSDSEPSSKRTHKR